MPIKRYSVLFLLLSCLISSIVQAAEPDPEEAPPKVTRQQIQEKMKSGFQKKFLTETEDPKYASVIAGETWSAVSETFALEGMTLSTLQEFKIPHLENVNKVLTEVGLGMALAQYVIDLANDNEEVGTLNLAKSLALYGLSKSAITILNSASLAISWVDYALNKLGTTAIGARYEKWEDAYRRYYSDTSNSEVWHSYEDWKEALKDAHTESEINGVIFGYLDGFWMGDDCEAYLRKGHWLFTLMGRYSLAMPDKKERTKIRNEYFRTVLSHKIRPYLYRLGKERAFDFYKKRMEAFRDKLSALYKLNIKLKSPEDPVGEMTYTVGPWVRQTKEDGTHMLIFRMYAYLKAGMPDEIIVTLPEGEKINAKMPAFPEERFDRDLWLTLYVYSKIDTVVLDKKTKKPIDKAFLTLAKKDYTKTAKSDAKGQIIIGKFPSGEYHVMLSAKGYKNKKGRINFNKPHTQPFYLEPTDDMAFPKQYEGKATFIFVTESDFGAVRTDRTELECHINLELDGYGYVHGTITRTVLGYGTSREEGLKNHIMDGQEKSAVSGLYKDGVIKEQHSELENIKIRLKGEYDSHSLKGEYVLIHPPIKAHDNKGAYVGKVWIKKKVIFDLEGKE